MDGIGIARRIASACRGPIDADDPGQVDPDLLREVAPLFDRLCSVWYGLRVEGLARPPRGPACTTRGGGP